MFKHAKYILRVYFHNGEILETETTVEEVNKICEIFTEDKEDIFSNDICMKLSILHIRELRRTKNE